MTTKPATYDWVGARGEKWAKQLAGMEATLMPVNEPLIHALQLSAPLRIAEVGCGGGGTAIEILRRAPAGSVVHAFDISPKLIEIARERTRSDMNAIAFEVADMTTAAPEKPYDRLVSRFGVMFFEDPHAAFANLARWIEPGGRFAFAVWGPPSDNPWITSARDAVARVAEVPQPDPNGPGPFRYADSGTLLSLLDRAGLSELEVADWRGALPIGGGLAPAEAAHFALSSFSSFGELLANAGDGAFEEAHRALTASFSRHETGGAVWMDARVHIVTGART